MKNFRAVLLAIVLLLLTFGCQSGGAGGAGPSPFHAEISFVGNGDARWDPFERIFVGHVEGAAFVGGRDHFMGTPWAAIHLTDGKRRVINRGLQFDQEFDLTEQIPYWTRVLFPEAALHPDGYWVAKLAGGEEVRIQPLAP